MSAPNYYIKNELDVCILVVKLNIKNKNIWIDMKKFVQKYIEI